MKIFTTFASKIFISPLSWLLHHANRKYHSKEFYDIKNRILKKYGQHICYDVQFIEGKKCHSCDGTGIYVGVRWSDIHWGKTVSYQETCYHCYQGWYKRPVWNILARLQLGKYTFHQPYHRVYEKPDNSIPVIEGYIEHRDSKYSDFAATILFLIYERGYLKRWYRSAGTGRYVRWWLPQHWINNIIYHIKHRQRIRDLAPNVSMECYQQSELPF